jgi:hypothetical protein
MMTIRPVAKSLLLTIGGLFVAFFACSQNSLVPWKVTVFRDAAQIGWKGIVRFQQQTADVALPGELEAESLDLIPGSPDVRISSYRLRRDTVLRKVTVRNWTDVLRANISKPVTILYEVGAEFDEVSGTVRMVNAEDKLLLLHGSGNSEYFIPLDQIRQVIVDNISEYRVDEKSIANVLEINISADVAFVPIEMFTIHDGLSWTPLCRIRILGSDKARLQLLAVIRNDVQDMVDVDFDLSPSSLRSEGQFETSLTSAGKLSLKKGNQIILNLREADLAYEALYQCRIPWDFRQCDAQNHNFSVDNTIRFSPPDKDNFPCNSYSVIDENNRNVANMGLSEASADGMVTLNLGPEKQMRVTLVEEQQKTSRKQEKINGTTYERVTIQGKILCYNVGQKFIRLDISREIFGEVTESGKGNIGTAADGKKAMEWKISLDKGQKKDLVYTYEALIPARDQ